MLDCYSCGEKFSNVIRKEYKCGKCQTGICKLCIKKSFLEKFYCKCYSCDYFFTQINTCSLMHLNKIYKMLVKNEDKTSLFYNFREQAINKLQSVKHRCNFLQLHVQKFPEDKIFKELLKKEINFKTRLNKICIDSELLFCKKCNNGYTSVHQTTLKYQTMYKILMTYETKPTEVLPKILEQLINQDFKRKCLVCNEDDPTTLEPISKLFSERRCKNCNFLIQYYQKHFLGIICCPNCKEISSRWFFKTQISDVLKNIYHNFYINSCTLVNQDTRE